MAGRCWMYTLVRATSTWNNFFPSSAEAAASALIFGIQHVPFAEPEAVTMQTHSRCLLLPFRWVQSFAHRPRLWLALAHSPPGVIGLGYETY